MTFPFAVHHLQHYWIPPMIKLILFISIIIPTLTIVKAESTARILAISGTSQSSESADAACLLDPDCQGEWRPEAKDNGRFEGIFIQFEMPTNIAYIELDTVYDLEHVDAPPTDVQKNTDTSYIEDELPQYELSINGKNTDDKQRPFRSYTKLIPSKNKEQKISTTEFLSQSYSSSSIDVKARSLFIKRIDGYPANLLAISSIRFYDKNKKQLQLKLPHYPDAQIKATSTLQPELAYSAQNLFDSKNDFAWSTNSKKNNGINESLTLTFMQPQNINAIYFANGYQRSISHFSKNGRIKSLMVSAPGHKPQTIQLESKMGMQKVELATALNSVKKITLTIKDIYKGSRYKDVLLSEMIFESPNKTLLIPKIQHQKPKTPKNLKAIIDRSYDQIAHGFYTDQDSCAWLSFTPCNPISLRFRSNGTFVIYMKKFFNSDGGYEQDILEGNWSTEKNAIRIFGKRYTSGLNSAIYLEENSQQAPKATIFQSKITIKPVKEMTQADLDNLFLLMNDNTQSFAKEKNDKFWYVSILNYNHQIRGPDKKTIIQKFKEYFKNVDAYYVSSSIFTGVFVEAELSDWCDDCGPY